MKKTLHVLFILSILLLIPLFAQEQKQEEKKPDPMEKMSIVKETQPVPEKMEAGFNSITGKEAVAHLRFISSDLLQGRDTASHGFDISAQYIATMFELWGIKPAGDYIRPASGGMFSRSSQPAQPYRSYFQKIELRESLERKGILKAEWQKGKQRKTQTFYSDKDFTFYSSGNKSYTAPVVFVGYGIQEKSLKLDEYKGLDIKGKIVMMLSEYPGKDDPDSPFNQKELKEKYNPPRRMRRMTSPKVRIAREKGAVAVLLVENSPHKNPSVAERILARREVSDENPIFPGERRNISLIEGKGLSMPWNAVPTIRISREMADNILEYSDQNIASLKKEIETTLKSKSMELNGVSITVTTEEKSKLVRCRNVLGYIQGADPKLKDEVIVIGAHLDHLGVRGDYIFNGADDNGSGSVGVLEIAEAFAKNPVKPKRSVLFALWTGEEKGLLGSRYYVQNPYFPLKKTVANINLDMISRIWDVKRLKMMSRMFSITITDDLLKKISMKDFMVVMYDAKTPELGEVYRENNQYVGLSLYLNASENAMSGSDHAPFGMSNVPWTFLNSAITKDYHQPTDSVEKASAKLMERAIRLTYLTAFRLADK